MDIDEARPKRKADKAYRDGAALILLLYREIIGGALLGHNISGKLLSDEPTFNKASASIGRDRRSHHLILATPYYKLLLSTPLRRNDDEKE